MSIKKQKLYNEIETLPEELTNQVINFIEYLKLSYLDTEAPDSVTIKNKKDLKEKLQKGLEDIKANRVYSLYEAFTKIDNIQKIGANIMKKYIVEISETAEQDLENIISYLKYSLAGDIIADKYKILFKQELKDLENIAGSMPILSEDLTGHKNIRKVNVRNYIIFYTVDEENFRALVLRIGHAFMDWEKYLKEE